MVNEAPIMTISPSPGPAGRDFRAKSKAQSASLAIAPVNEAPSVTITPPGGAIEKVGVEILVNTATLSAQREPSVAGLAFGGFVVSWTDFSGGDDSGGIKAQLFDAAGAKVGQEIQVNTVTANFQDDPAVTSLASGGFVVTWRDRSGQGGDAGDGIRAQIFDAAGGKVGDELFINNVLAGDQSNPAVTELASGRIVVSWTENFGGQTEDIKARILDPSGSPLAAEFLVNTTTNGLQHFPEITALASGGFVVTWRHWTGSNSHETRAQIFDAAGTPVGNELLVNSAAAALERPAIAALASGGFVVTWPDAAGDASGYGVKAQIFDAAGTKVGSEFLVNTTTNGTQWQPTVTGLPSGGFVISWTDESGQGPDPTYTSIRAQVFDAGGAKVGTEFLVNTAIQNVQNQPTVDALASGRFVVSWRDYSGEGGDTSDSAIKAQLFGAAMFQANEQVALNLKGAIVINDVDAESGILTVTLSVTSGRLHIESGDSGAAVTGQDAASIQLSGTLDQINALLGSQGSSVVDYNAASDAPAGSDTLTIVVNDNGNTGSGGAKQDVETATILIASVDDPPVAANDGGSTDEAAAKTIAILANDTDIDGPPPTIAEIDGQLVSPGQTITLAGSQAKVTLNNDGTITYDPDGRFNWLTAPGSGAVNTSAVDTFTYKLAGGTTTANVAVTVNGQVSSDDLLYGDNLDNVITGTPQRDILMVQQGGNDTIHALAGNDTIYFGSQFTAADTVDAGGGVDSIILQGAYAALSLGTGTTSNIGGVETLSLAPGDITDYGDTANAFYDYDLTTLNANVAAGGILKINGFYLRVGEDFTFNGSAETDARFILLAGQGVDQVTGGEGNDIFVFGHDGRFGSSDVVDGGGGYDSLYLRGDYHLDFGAGGFAGTLSGIESITLGWAADNQFVAGGDGEFDYVIVWDDAMLADGATVTVNGSGLGANETMNFNGSDDLLGNFRLWGGAADDTLAGGGGTDLLYGGIGWDDLTGNGGADVFRYHSTNESAPTPGDFDMINGFTHLVDRIDLSVVDANSNAAGNQAFTFIGSSPFASGGASAGQLRAVQLPGSFGPNTWQIEGDTDGNGTPDLLIRVAVQLVQPLTEADFFL